MQMHMSRGFMLAALLGPAGRAYIVAVDPPTSAGLGRTLLPNVQVATGVETAVGTAVLP